MATAQVLLSSDTVLPALVTQLKTYLPASVTSRTDAGGTALEEPPTSHYLLDMEYDTGVRLRPTCVVRPRPDLNDRREWQTPHRDDGIVCDVVVVYQAETSPKSIETALAWQRVIDVALTRIAHARAIDGVWTINVGTPINEPAGENRFRRAAGHQATVWTRVSREL